MNTLKKIAIIMVGVSGLVLIYNYFMLQPHLPEIDYDTVSTTFDWDTYSAYRHQSDWTGLVGTSLAGLGAIFGFIVFFKTKDKGGLISGLLGLAIGATTFWVCWAHVN
ncbi:MAG TPA: hypothetical protein VD905_13985 [Flavobacteriales bacterium]|nr:hypothetical protein [Flavobacteriales bacterium]